MAQDALRVTVELDYQEQPAEGPITGRVCMPGAHTREFVGWLELLAFLDEAINDMKQAPDGRGQLDLGRPDHRHG